MRSLRLHALGVWLILLAGCFHDLGRFPLVDSGPTDASSNSGDGLQFVDSRGRDQQQPDGLPHTDLAVDQAQDAPAPTYRWKKGEWGDCSQQCDTGTRTRSVWCERSDGVTVADGLCSANDEPDASEPCNALPCYWWHAKVCSRDTGRCTNAANPYFLNWDCCSIWKPDCTVSVDVCIAEIGGHGGSRWSTSNCGGLVGSDYPP